MCFYAPFETEPKIATKDIVCYKVTTRQTRKEFYSLWFDFKYIPGVIQPIQKITPVKRAVNRNLEINKGYHSYKKYPLDFLSRIVYILTGYADVYTGNRTLIKKFIIPTGTLYYENYNKDRTREEEYVSETIMMK
jgi:hypothetical protein